MRTRTSTSTLTFSLASVLALGSAASLGLLGCDKSNKPTDDPSTTGGAVEQPAADDAPAAEGDVAAAQEGGEAGGEEGGELAWHDMNRDQRMTHMGTVVLPGMKAAFKQQGFDSFTCANCHGQDYKEVDFQMPNDLTPLNAENPIQSGMDMDEEMTKFMVSVVLPEMAEMLGEETDVTTGKGEFGCLSCHLPE